jgi:hypothetical protein
LGVLLVVRHRTARLVGILCGLAVVGVEVNGSGVVGRRTVMLLAASFASVAASRVLAPGPARWAAWWSAGTAWLAPAGRLLGVVLVTLPVVLLGSVATQGGADIGSVGLVLVAMILAAAIASPVMAATPLVGPSVAGGAGVVAAWLGLLTPSVMEVWLGSRPLLARPVVAAWELLPLGWRGARLVERAEAGDAFLLLTWIPAGILLAVWASRRGTRA